MTKLRRPRDIFGPGNPLPVGKTTFWENYVYHEGGEENVPGTNTPRLKLVNIGVRAVAAFDDEVAALVEGLRRERDAKPAAAAAAVTPKLKRQHQRVSVIRRHDDG